MLRCSKLPVVVWWIWDALEGVARRMLLGSNEGYMLVSPALVWSSRSLCYSL